MPLVAATALEIAAQWPEGPDPPNKVLVRKPDACPGLSAERAADLLFGLLGPELYLIFIRDRGWSPDAWEEWARATLTSQLCADAG